MAGFVKAFNFPIDYVLYDISYVNLIMYGAVLPSYESMKRKGKGNPDKEQEVVKADDPANRAKVREILNSFD